MKKGRLGGFRGAGKKGAWVGSPNLFYPAPTPDVPLCVIVMMMMRRRWRMTPPATSGAHNGLAGWCRQGSIMDAGPHWEGQTKYKGWDDWSECYTLLRRRGFGGKQEERERGNVQIINKHSYCVLRNCLIGTLPSKHLKGCSGLSVCLTLFQDFKISRLCYAAKHKEGISKTTCFGPNVHWEDATKGCRFPSIRFLHTQ